MRRCAGVHEAFDLLCDLQQGAVAARLRHDLQPGGQAAVAGGKGNRDGREPRDVERRRVGHQRLAHGARPMADIDRCLIHLRRGAGAGRQHEVVELRHGAMQPGGEVAPRLLRARVVAQRDALGALEPLDGFAAVVGSDAIGGVAAEVLDAALGEDDVRKGFEDAVERSGRIDGRARKEFSELRNRGVERGRDFGARRHGRDLAHHPEARRWRSGVLRHFDVECARQQRDVVDRRAKKARVVQRRCQCKDAARGQCAEARLEADDPAQRRRDPHRSAGVRAKAGRHGATGNRRGRAAAGAAGNARAVQRVQGIAEGGAGRGHAPCELMRGRLADGNGAALDQRAHHVGVGVRKVPQVGGRAVAGFDALGVDQVLDADGQPFQRPLPALRIAPVAFCRGGQRAVPVDRGEGAQVALAGLCGLECLLDQGHGRDAPGGQGVERVAQAGCGRDHGRWRAIGVQGFSPGSESHGAAAPAITAWRVRKREWKAQRLRCAARDLRPELRTGSPPWHPCSGNAASNRATPGSLPCTGKAAWPAHRHSARHGEAHPTSTPGRDSSGAPG